MGSPACVPIGTCGGFPWCEQSGFEEWCASEGAGGSCPSPFCELSPPSLPASLSCTHPVQKRQSGTAQLTEGEPVVWKIGMIQIASDLWTNVFSKLQWSAYTDETRIAAVIERAWILAYRHRIPNMHAKLFLQKSKDKVRCARFCSAFHLSVAMRVRIVRSSSFL